MNKTISEAITFLRFPLACMIVLKHYYVPDISAEIIGGGSVYSNIGNFVSQILPAIPVPLFFIISGYLYFCNLPIDKGFNKEQYKDKTKKRIKSLLIPYLCWNLLVLVFYAITQQLTTGTSVMAKEGYILISDYKIIDYIKAFTAIDSTGLPIDGPLWFIRDLFIMAVLSPLFYYGIKYLKYGWLVLMIVINFATPFTHIMGPIFFSTGATIALIKNDFMDTLTEERTESMSIILFFVLLISFTISCFGGYKTGTLLFNFLFRLVGSLCILSMATIFVKANWNKIPLWMGTASFFIFAIHKPIQVILRRLTFSMIHPQNELLLCSLIFIIPTLTIALSLLIFYIIKTYIPSLKFLNGYRL